MAVAFKCHGHGDGLRFGAAAKGTAYSVLIFRSLASRAYFSVSARTSRANCSALLGERLAHLKLEARDDSRRRPRGHKCALPKFDH
jgi:hypothetical protein